MLFIGKQIGIKLNQFFVKSLPDKKVIEAISDRSRLVIAACREKLRACLKQAVYPQQAKLLGLDGLQPLAHLAEEARRAAEQTVQFAQKIARQLAAVIAPLHNGVAQHELKEYRFGEILQRLFVNRRRQLRHVRRLVAAGD